MTRILRVAIVSALLSVVPVAARGQLAVGANLNLGSDSDVGIGARLLVGLGEAIPNVEGIGSFDYFFPGGNLDWWEVNANLTVPVSITSGFQPYLGGGLNVTNTSMDIVDATPEFGDEGETDIGLNILGGLKLPASGATPFVELRTTIGGGSQVVLSAGLLFGSVR